VIRQDAGLVAVRKYFSAFCGVGEAKWGEGRGEVLSVCTGSNMTSGQRTRPIA
jgi:hypothetical protein